MKQHKIQPRFEQVLSASVVSNTLEFPEIPPSPSYIFFKLHKFWKIYKAQIYPHTLPILPVYFIKVPIMSISVKFVLLNLCLSFDFFMDKI